MLTAVVVLALAVLGLVVYAAIITSRKDKPVIDMDKALSQLFEKSEELRSKNKEEIHGGVKELLEGNQKQIDLIVREVRSQLKDGQDKTESLAKQSASIQQQLKAANEATKDLHATTESLKNVLANNRLRGAWGEQVAEELLLNAGFLENQHYHKQRKSGEGRPDFTLLLPDGSKLNIDVKFAYDHLQLYQEAQERQDKEAMKKHIKDFEAAIKNKIKEITSRDYISPEGNTLDFVVMFIPNEMIFSFIYEKLPSIIDECNKNKVLMTGPFGFTALLRLVLQAHRNLRYQKGLRQILGYVEQFKQEYDKFGGKLEQLGKQLETTQKTYRDVETTRSKKLSSVVEKIGEYSEQEKLDRESETERLDIGDRQ